jgi:large subunit ribosomal protein L3
MRGILGKKVGMTQIFDAKGDAIPVTVIEAGPCFVTQIKTKKRDGYDAIQLGFEEVQPRKLTQGQRGHLGLLKTSDKHPQRKVVAEAVPPVRHLREFPLEDGDAQYQEGQRITCDLFIEGERVDVIGTSKGRGFAGAVKRYHFKGGKKTHGQSDRLRAPGSSGATTTPGRVFKGTRRPGHMGNERVTSQNIKVIRVDPERNLLALAGAVPGAKDGLVMIRESVKQLQRRRTRGGL